MKVARWWLMTKWTKYYSLTRNTHRRATIDLEIVGDVTSQKMNCYLWLGNIIIIENESEWSVAWSLSLTYFESSFHAKTDTNQWNKGWNVRIEKTDASSYSSLYCACVYSRSFSDNIGNLNVRWRALLYGGDVKVFISEYHILSTPYSVYESELALSYCFRHAYVHQLKSEQLLDLREVEVPMIYSCFSICLTFDARASLRSILDRWLAIWAFHLFFFLHIRYYFV